MVTITGRTTITIEPRALLQNALDVLDSGDANLPMWESMRLRIAAYKALKAYLADQERSR